MTPTIETIRPGVAFAPYAAASFRRFEADLGRRIDTNSTYRDYDKQLGMYQAWNAWVDGTGPQPAHSRAISPDYSKHCQGLAMDSDDWSTPGFIEEAAEYGWIRTAASDPTERHHFEYQWRRDQHRNDPDPDPIPLTLEEDMILIESLPDRGRALIGPGQFCKINNSEELREASRLATKTLRGNARQFDVWKSLALRTGTRPRTVDLTPAQMEQVADAARAGGADAIAGLEFVVQASPA